MLRGSAVKEVTFTTRGRSKPKEARMNLIRPICAWIIGLSVVLLLLPPLKEMGPNTKIATLALVVFVLIAIVVTVVLTLRSRRKKGVS